MKRDTWAEQEQRERIYYRDGGLCFTCEEPIPMAHFELAHIIPQRKHWREKYGDAIVYHDDNMRATCPNASCNNAQSIGNNDYLCDKKADEIMQIIADNS